MSILSLLLGRPRKGAAHDAAPAVDTASDVIRAILLRIPDADRLRLVKTAYLVQVMHLGRHGQRVFPDWFHATAMGIYDKDLSRECRYRISRRHRDRTDGVGPSLSPNVSAIVDEICEELKDRPMGTMTAITQMEGGAWRRLWQPDPRDSLPISDPMRFRGRRTPSDEGPVIDIEHMLCDYRLLTSPKDEAIAA